MTLEAEGILKVGQAELEKVFVLTPDAKFVLTPDFSKPKDF